MKQVASLLVLLIALSGCTSHKSQYQPFRPPEGYANHREVAGVAVGGEAYADKKHAKQAFGFDIRGAGLLPVQLVLDNKSGYELEISTSQTFLVDAAGNYWPVVPNTVAFDRLEQSTQFASFFGKGTGKGALIGAAAGGILATALGIVSGGNVAAYLGKGAAVGAAGGAVIGGTSEGSSREREYRISQDLREKGLEAKAIPDKHLANGFLFFPGEAKSARELRLQWRERETGKEYRTLLPL
ncbi:lipoprotein [Geomonas silvestris]|uniref:Lipoprotein n=1 Tax=Geomonas silvestris TaxID=2740184 RepID=A0A6V8MGG8_9BACT|nr:glycine zipper family protein [Geomonas silvestris]GFO59014.1 lipoprotein [Geomonas silvestris]